MSSLVRNIRRNRISLRHITHRLSHPHRTVRQLHSIIFLILINEISVILREVDICRNISSDLAAISPAFDLTGDGNLDVSRQDLHLDGVLHTLLQFGRNELLCKFLAGRSRHSHLESHCLRNYDSAVQCIVSHLESLHGLHCRRLGSHGRHCSKIDISGSLRTTKFHRCDIRLRLVVDFQGNLGQHVLERNHDGIDRRGHILFLAGDKVRRRIALGLVGSHSERRRRSRRSIRIICGNGRWCQCLRIPFQST